MNDEDFDELVDKLPNHARNKVLEAMGEEVAEERPPEAIKAFAAPVILTLVGIVAIVGLGALAFITLLLALLMPGPTFVWWIILFAGSVWVTRKVSKTFPEKSRAKVPADDV